MRFQISKGGADRFQVEPDFTQTRNGKIVGSTHWEDAEGRRHERFQVITVGDDGKIADLQGFATRRSAERFARR